MKRCFYKFTCFIRKSSFYKMLLPVNICIVRIQFQDDCCTYNSFTILLNNTVSRLPDLIYLVRQIRAIIQEF